MSLIPLLCRFCAKEHPEIVDLKTATTHRQAVLQKLSQFNEFFVDFFDTKLPETICPECYRLLNISYDFFMQVRESQTVLKFSFNRFNEFVLATDPIKEEIIDNQDSGDGDIKPDSDCDVTGSRSWSTYPWQCSHCNVSLPSINAVRHHNREAHKTCYGFQCADCNLKIDGFEEFVVHVRQERDELIKYCEYCNTEMVSTSHQNRHVFDHICTQCGQKFDNQLLLRIHIAKYAKKHTKHLAFNIKTCEFVGIKTDPTEENTDSSNKNNCPLRPLQINKSRKRSPNLPKYIENMPDHSKDIPEYEKKNIEIEKWSEYPKICKFCGFKGDTEKFKMHCLKNHKRCFAMKCIDCNNDWIDTFEQFVEHVRTHRPVFKNKCPHCDIEIMDFKDPHILTHAGRYRCSICTENFGGSKKLRQHDKRLETPMLKPPMERRKGPITDKDVTCDICGKRMKTPLSLRQHKVVHTKRERNHTCDICGKAFYTDSTLRSHRETHEGILKETCKICNRSFLNLRRLKVHITTHNVLDTPFQCDHCKKFFGLKESLARHMKAVHINYNPFECQYCGKKFRIKSTMRIHENQHTGARPYSCDICCISFACWSNCDKHMRRIHGRPLAKTVRTAHGKLPLDPLTGQPSEFSITSNLKDWSKNILEKQSRKSFKIQQA